MFFPPVVSREEWLKARMKLLKKEKEHTKARDDLTHTRQNLPWVKVEKDYIFDGQDGKVYLCDLFDGKSQLVVYHFMFEKDWEEGCKSCSFLADHYEPAITHLANRDVSMITVSKAPLEKLEAFKKRMNWNFKWLSSENSDFNRDFHVSFTEDEIKTGKGHYNFEESSTFLTKEAPGISVFVIDRDGQVYHTYSAYARGLENFLTAYHLLDIVPKGSDEEGLSYGMEWLRHKDRYGDETFIDPYTLKK
jgi:predicted dithiol-disulfide oxidoreductase (DUF899 family)